MTKRLIILSLAALGVVWAVRYLRNVQRIQNDRAVVATVPHGIRDNRTFAQEVMDTIQELTEDPRYRGFSFMDTAPRTAPPATQADFNRAWKR